MSPLENYYNEHASQARQHEDHRERMTNIILSINGILIGFITFGELSIWSLFPAVSIIFLGFYGFFFAGKHYERFKFHTSIMGEIRSEIDKLYMNPSLTTKRSLADLRDTGASNHYKGFGWPEFMGRKTKNEGETVMIAPQEKDKIVKVKQGEAKSWIARQRAHVFWECIHILMIFVGVGLTLAIIIKSTNGTSEKALKIEIVEPTK